MIGQDGTPPVSTLYFLLWVVIRDLEVISSSTSHSHPKAQQVHMRICLQARHASLVSLCPTPTSSAITPDHQTQPIPGEEASKGHAGIRKYVYGPYAEHRLGHAKRLAWAGDYSVRRIEYQPCCFLVTLWLTGDSSLGACRRSHDFPCLLVGNTPSMQSIMSPPPPEKLHGGETPVYLCDEERLNVSRWITIYVDANFHLMYATAEKSSYPCTAHTTMCT